MLAWVFRRTGAGGGISCGRPGRPRPAGSAHGLVATRWRSHAREPSVVGDIFRGGSRGGGLPPRWYAPSRAMCVLLSPITRRLERPELDTRRLSHADPRAMPTDDGACTPCRCTWAVSVRADNTTASGPGAIKVSFHAPCASRAGRHGLAICPDRVRPRERERERERAHRACVAQPCRRTVLVSSECSSLPRCLSPSLRLPPFLPLPPSPSLDAPRPPLCLPCPHTSLTPPKPKPQALSLTIGLRGPPSNPHF